MASHPLGRIVVAALLAAACSPPQLPPLVDRGEVETRSANGHIAAANAALKARKTSAETKAFVATLRGRIEAFNAAPSRADGATIATLGHAAGVVEQALGRGPDRPVEAALAYFADLVEDHPAEWGEDAETLARVLELDAVPLARAMAGEVRALRAQLESDATALSSGEADRRCGAGAAEEPVAVTAGRLVASILASVRPSAHRWADFFHQPAICAFEPARIGVARADDGPVRASASALLVYGLNLADAPAPRALVRDAAGETVEGIALAPIRRTSWQVEVPLEEVDFSPAADARVVVVAFEGGPPPTEVAAPLFAIPARAPVARIDVTPDLGMCPLTVRLTNATENASARTTWSWTFSDGATSAEREPPAHVFTAPRPHVVTLTARDARGESTATHSVTVATNRREIPALLPLVPLAPPTHIVPATAEACRGFLRESCTIRQQSRGARCTTRWASADVHDCRCVVSGGWGSPFDALQPQSCVAVVTLIAEGCSAP